MGQVWKYFMRIALLFGIPVQIQRNAWPHLQVATQQSAIKTTPLRRKPTNATSWKKTFRIEL